MNQKDLIAVLLTLAGLSALATDASFAKSLTTVAGGYAPTILGALGVVSAVAAQILRVIGSPSPSAGMQVSHIPNDTTAVVAATVKPNV